MTQSRLFKSGGSESGLVALEKVGRSNFDRVHVLLEKRSGASFEGRL